MRLTRLAAWVGGMVAGGRPHLPKLFLMHFWRVAAATLLQTIEVQVLVRLPSSSLVCLLSAVRYQSLWCQMSGQAQSISMLSS